MTMPTIVRSSLLPLLLVTALALLALAACNDGDDGNGETDGASPTAADTSTDGDADAAADGGTDGETDGGTDGTDGADAMDGTDGTEDGAADDGAGDEPPPDGGDEGDAGDGVTEIRMIEGIQFDPTQVVVPASTSVTILANNVAGGVPHSFALYASQESAAGGDDPIVETETCSGPCEREVMVNLDGGQYYFRCEVHGDSMSGTLTAR